ncbi:MAG: ABC transporter substrate-binding protein [Spirochaetales bacterium]|nr:ABC transporter substrate-binding protein [Spirochaetales bacterium]
MFPTQKFIAVIAAAAVLLVSAAPVKAGGQKEDRALRCALPGNPSTLDPQKTQDALSFQVVKSVYDTLVEPDAKGLIVPALAESWTISGDGRLWTFRLRRGVSFHNGGPFTSRDVKATIQRIQDPATASPRAIEYDAIRNILTPDDFTVQFELNFPAAPLLATLASGWSAILPADLIEAGHDFGAHPTGTGPFVFEAWLRGSKITLTKNPAYWMAGAPRISGLDFRIIPERAVRLQGILSGQLDVCDLYDSADVLLLEKNPRTRVEKSLTSRVDVIAINTSRFPLSDLKMRRAITHAIDKQSVLDIAYGGGEVVGTFMDAGDPYYRDFTDLYPYDPEKARALAADYRFEKPLEMVVPQNYEYHIRAAQLYQQMLGKAGIPVRIRLVDWTVWLEDVYRKANFDLSVIGHLGKLDPDARLRDYGTEKTYVRWIQPEAARRVGQAGTLSGFAARKKVYDEVLEIMAREAPFVYTGTAYRYTGIRDNVEGYIMLPKIDAPDFRSVILKQEKG